VRDVETITTLLRQRFAETRARMVDHPWALAGFGVLAGVWLASHRKRERDVGMIAAIVGAIGLRFVREVAMLQMANIARRWVADEAPARSRYTH
jgi:hypothetical protein